MRKAIFALCEAGALLLAVAQFLALSHLHVSSTRASVSSASVHSAHSWGVLLIALLAAFLGGSLMVNPNRFSLLLVGMLGAIALVIALSHDLSDARSHGLELVGSHYESARSVIGIGLYVEIAGALILLFAAALGFLLGGDALTPAPRDDAPRRRQDPLQARRRSRTESGS